MLNALNDIGSGFIHWRLWSMLAVEDLKRRYHRTLLGPVWIIGSFAAFIWVKIFIFSQLSTTDWTYFAAYLTLGYAVWTLLNNAITEGAQCFVGAKSWILGVKTSYSLFIYQSLLGTVIMFVLTFITAMAISYFLVPYTPQAALQAGLGVMAIIFSMFWIQLLLGTISIFVRDMIQLTQTVMRLMFFLTPIIWLPQDLGARADLVKYNPFAHYIAIVRAPLLGESVTMLNWLVVGGITLGAIILSIILFALAKPRIPAHV